MRSVALVLGHTVGQWSGVRGAAVLSTDVPATISEDPPSIRRVIGFAQPEGALTDHGRVTITGIQTDGPSIRSVVV